MCEEACWQTAWALNFWWILNVSDSDKAKEMEKNCILISLFMNVTIPGTPGIHFFQFRKFSLRKSWQKYISTTTRSILFSQQGITFKDRNYLCKIFLFFNLMNDFSWEWIWMKLQTMIKRLKECLRCVYRC